ncbi:MAG: Holliday junction resolvase RuvX [Candidatus Omnitrophota bacterium]
MAHWLGLDLGTKRAGIALAETSLGVATPHAVLEAGNRPALIRSLQQICADYAVSRIVVGLPVSLKGEVSIAAKHVMEEVERLKVAVPCEWVLWDERLSSGEADRVLLASGMSQTKRREVRDKLAAQRILQNYIDHFRNRAG